MHINKKSKFLILNILFVSFLFSCSSKNDPIAKFKNGKILRKELTYALNKLPKQAQKEYNTSNKKLISLIKNLALKKIVFQWASKTNIVDISYYSNYIKNKKENDLFSYILNNKIDKPDESVKSSDIKKFNTTISVKLIWIKSFIGDSAVDKEKARTLAYSIYDKLNNGVGFGKLANKYSSDKNNFMYGKLNNITKKDVSPEIYNALLKMNPGDVSDIIEDANSYQIVKLLNRVGDKYSIARIYVKKNNKNALNKIKQAQKVIAAGYLFGIVANEFTEDNNNFKDGKIAPFRFDRMYLKISELAYELDNGEISKPLETRYGYFILKKINMSLPDKKILEKLSKNDRYLNRIKMIKNRYERYLNQDNIIKKIIKDYKIKFNEPLLKSVNITNENEIIAEVPALKLKIKAGDAKMILTKQIGPKRSDDIIIKKENLINRFLIKKIVVDYGIKKGWDKEDEFILKLNDEFYTKLYNDVTSKVRLNIDISDKEIKDYYQKNKFQFYKTKIVKHKPVKTLMKLKEAKKIIEHKLLNEKRAKMLKKWETTLLKQYNFKLIEKNLSLKKDYDYYIQRAQTAMNEKKYNKALDNLEKAIKMNPSGIEAYIKKYILYDKMNDTKKSIAVFEKIKKLNSADAKILIREYENGTPRLRLKLIELMGKFPTSEIVNKLIEIYSNATDAQMKEASIRSLGQARAIESFDILLSDLKNFNKVFKSYPAKEKEIIKWYLIEALGYIGNTDATGYLISMLKKSNNINLKCFILEALGRIKDKSAVPVLNKYLKDKVWGVRVLAAESLKNITGKEYKIEPPQNKKRGGKK